MKRDHPRHPWSLQSHQSPQAHPRAFLEPPQSPPKVSPRVLPDAAPLRCLLPDASSQMPSARCLLPDAFTQMLPPDAFSQMPPPRCLFPDASSQMSRSRCFLPDTSLPDYKQKLFRVRVGVIIHYLVHYFIHTNRDSHGKHEHREKSRS